MDPTPIAASVWSAQIVVCGCLWAQCIIIIQVAIKVIKRNVTSMAVYNVRMKCSTLGKHEYPLHHKERDEDAGANQEQPWLGQGDVCLTVSI